MLLILSSCLFESFPSHIAVIFHFVGIVENSVWEWPMPTRMGLVPLFSLLLSHCHVIFCRLLLTLSNEMLSFVGRNVFDGVVAVSAATATDVHHYHWTFLVPFSYIFFSTMICLLNSMSNRMPTDNGDARPPVLPTSYISRYGIQHLQKYKTLFVIILQSCRIIIIE